MTMLARTFVATAAGIVALAIVVIVLRRAGLPLPYSLFAFPLEGYSGNRNAFGLMLILAGCASPWTTPASRPWLLGLIFAGLWLTGSRAAGSTIVVVAAVAMITGRFLVKDVVRAVALTVGVIAVMELTPLLTSIFGRGGHTADAIRALWVFPTAPVSDQDRFKSILDGLKMFADNPVFGRGLGAYIADQGKAAYVVIHSTPVWLMAELGLVGLLAFVIPALRIVQTEAGRVRFDPVSGLLVFIIFAFGMMSAMHEMLYQRAIWLLLGAVLSVTPLRAGRLWH